MESQTVAFGRDGLTSRRAGKHLFLGPTCEAGEKKKCLFFFFLCFIGVLAS